MRFTISYPLFKNKPSRRLKTTKLDTFKYEYEFTILEVEFYIRMKLTLASATRECSKNTKSQKRNLFWFTQFNNQTGQKSVAP
jgi:hypothetical protein